MDETRTDCAKGIGALTHWAAGVQLADVPAPVLERAARVLADDLGAIVGARDEPEVACFHARLLARPGAAEATVFRGGRTRTDRRSAAVGNAVAGDWLELDEGYRLTPCHAGLYVVPALLAEAEARDLPLAEVLRALALAYEVVTRVARAFSPRVLNLHSHARYAAVGASAATALAARLAADVMHASLTAAATLINVGPRNHLVSGALVRNVWPAVGAWSGMMSVEWAQCGIMGAVDGFHDVYTGLLDSDTRPHALTEDLGRGWAILDGYMKVFACCQHLHSAVEAVLEARPRVLDAGTLDAGTLDAGTLDAGTLDAGTLDAGTLNAGVRGGTGALERVQAIVVEAHPLAQLLPNPRPATTLGAKFSLPHAVAAALVTGSGGADAFASTTLHDPAIARLRERVTIAPYAGLPAPPNDRPARIRIRMCDGDVFEAQCLSAQGGSDRPFAAGVLAGKIETLVAGAYPRLPEVLSQVCALDPVRMQQGWSRIVADFCA